MCVEGLFIFMLNFFLALGMICHQGLYIWGFVRAQLSIRCCYGRSPLTLLPQGRSTASFLPGWSTSLHFSRGHHWHEHGAKKARQECKFRFTDRSLLAPLCLEGEKYLRTVPHMAFTLHCSGGGSSGLVWHCSSAKWASEPRHRIWSSQIPRGLGNSVSLWPGWDKSSASHFAFS